VQVSEESMLSDIYRELLCGLEGSEIYFKPLSRYVFASERCDWAEVRERAWALSEIAIGFHLAGEPLCSLDPRTNAGISPRLWHPEDRILVLAEQL
jgi:hypothetical protein